MFKTCRIRKCHFTSLILILLGTYSANGEEGLVKALLIGNWADPTIEKVGSSYYMSANNVSYVPSKLVWRSSDLRKWYPVCYASPNKPQGLATDLDFHQGRLYMYGGGGTNPWVQYSDPPFETWSDQIHLDLIEPQGIDGGHLVDDDGIRYLYTSRGMVTKLTPDGLKAQEAPMTVYEPWPMPDNLDIDISCVCLESPKPFKHLGWYYMVSAQGGTAGPATSHMATVARSHHVMGPWEYAPNSPLIWTRDRFESWWSKGHATLFEGPGGHWYAIYHGYPNGERTVGRCILISPIRWRDDDWPEIASEWPEGWDEPIEFHLSMSDDFDGPELGMQWQAIKTFDRGRYTFDNGELVVSALGATPGNSHPIVVNPRHLSYEIETEVVIEGDTHAGLILSYSPTVYVSVGLSSAGKIERFRQRSEIGPEPENKRILPHPAYRETRVKLKIRNNHQSSSYYYSGEDGVWKKLKRADDVSGFQINVYGGFLSLRPGIYTAGTGKARFLYFRYRGLE